MKADLKAVIDDELNRLKNVQPDDEFIPPTGEDLPRFIEPKAKLDEEALAIDELIAGVPRAQGYYIKLYKEVGTGNYEYKYRENNWETWTDLEDEVRKIVVSFTQKNPLKWGSGHYRLVFWCDRGVREKRKPIDLYIDADEPAMIPGMGFAPSPAPDAGSQIDALKNLLNVVSTVHPTVSPTDQLKANTDAFMKGMEMAQTKENSNNNALAIAMQSMSTMMTAFMSMMMAQNNNKPIIDESTKVNPVEMMKANVEMMKNMGIFEKPVEPKTKTLVEQVAEMKSLGLIKDETPKSLIDTVKELKELGLWQGSSTTESPIAKINEVKEMVSLAGELAGLGKGEPQTALDKMIDILVPKVPDMVSNITGAVSKYSEAVRTKGTGMTPVNPAITNTNNTPTTVSESKEDSDTMLFGFHPLFKELYKAIEMHDNTKFGYITQQVSSLLGEQLIKDIVTGNMNAEMLSVMIQQYGGHRFKDTMFITGKMSPYLNEYVLWIRATYDVKPLSIPLATPGTNPKPSTNHPIVNVNEIFATHCNKCGDIVEWSSKENFETDADHECGLQTGPNTFCNGTLVPTTNMPENVEPATV